MRVRSCFLTSRSMIKTAEKDSGHVQAIENDLRVTKVERFLRATAMDELPQLLNILRGDMSFVGPRALRPNEKEVHGNPEETEIEKIPGYQERLAVRPGLTGMAWHKSTFPQMPFVKRNSNTTFFISKTNPSSLTSSSSSYRFG